MKPRTKRKGRCLLAALAMGAASTALAVPAGAQFFDDRYPSERSRLQGPQRDFFPFSIFGDHGSYPSFNPSYPTPRPAQPVESTKAPPPRKVETPPTRMVVVIGDSLADWLGYGLEDAFADTPEIGIVRKIRPTSGLVHYEPRSDTPEWSQAVKDILATEKPSAIVVMLGLNDDHQALRERAPTRAVAQRNGDQPSQTAGQAQQNPASGPGETLAQPNSASTQPPSAPSADAPRPAQAASYDFQTDKWAELYGKRIDDMIAALKSKGVPVLWVGLPAIRGARATSDMSYLDELYRAHAEKAGITFVNIWDGFVDDRGQFAVQGPDFQGQIRRLRTGDGIHFTKAGAEKLAHYVEHELRRAISNRTVPVALPGSEEQRATKPGAAGSRPDAGPVVPLNAIGGGETGDLLGAASRPAQAASDPIATRVLSRGDAAPAPPGRADDFSWPRADAGANATSDESPPTGSPTPTAAAAKASGGKSDVKKPSEAKNQAAPDAAPPRPRRPRADPDGAPRPPLPIAPAANNAR